MPPYLRKRPGRPGLYFQRAVPLDVQEAIGKKVWIIKAGDTQAQARVVANRLWEATDREIAQARGTGNAVVLPAVVRQLDPHSKEAKAFDRLQSEAWLRGKTVDEVRDASEEEWDAYMTALPSDPVEIDKIRKLPRAEIRTAEELIDKAKLIKDPADLTLIEWRKRLKNFMEHAGLAVPTFGTKEQARAYRDSLLASDLAPTTIKTRINYLSGLWSVMVEEEWIDENIWSGVTRMIKADTKPKEVIAIEPIDAAAEAKLHGDQRLLYFLLRYSGMRLAEAAGLRYEDIRDGVIHIRKYDNRRTKTKQSGRQIPLHPRLQEMTWEGNGLILPAMYNDRTKRWGGGISWTRKIGLHPHGFRDHAKQRMREAGIDISVSRAVMGHRALDVGERYGAISMELKRQAIEVL